MIKTVTTKSGYTVSVETDKMDDMAYIDALAQLQTDDLKLPYVVDMILNPEDKTRLYDHVRTEDGRVPILKFAAEFGEVLNLLGKN